MPHLSCPCPRRPEGPASREGRELARDRDCLPLSGPAQASPAVNVREESVGRPGREVDRSPTIKRAGPCGRATYVPESPGRVAHGPMAAPAADVP